MMKCVQHLVKCYMTMWNLVPLYVYRFVLLEEDSAVQGHILSVPQLHPGIVVILKVGGEDALPGLAQHWVKPGIRGCLGGEVACNGVSLGILWYLWEPQIKLSCQQSLFSNFMACLIQIINGGKPLTWIDLVEHHSQKATRKGLYLENECQGD